MLRRSLRDTVARPPLAAPASRVYEALDTINPRVAVGNVRYRRGAPDGLPIPPADLRFLVAGTRDISWFLEGGRLAAVSITDALARAGAVVEDVHAMLDFGCGCGRVLRHWHALSRTRICGSDYSPKLVDWSRSQLGFAEVHLNQLKPPTDFAEGEFDLVYALSVFTHLTPEFQRPWFTDLARITKPGGHLLMSTHGEAYASRLDAQEAKRFRRGELVVKNNIAAPGSNTCAAYHPMAYVRDELASGLELLEFVPEGARGNPRQDLYVFGKPVPRR